MIKKCPRNLCNGSMIIDWDNEYVCMLCGHIEYIFRHSVDVDLLSRLRVLDDLRPRHGRPPKLRTQEQIQKAFEETKTRNRKRYRE